MNRWLVGFGLSILTMGILVGYATTHRPVAQVIEEPLPPSPEEQLMLYFYSKKSPLDADAYYILTLEHWKLLVAISAIESQFCNRQMYNNCFGTGGDAHYRRYSSFQASFKDANDLINYWQAKGRWLTVEDMNCHYVHPCNPNWVKVVNQTLKDLDEFNPRTDRSVAKNEP